MNSYIDLHIPVFSASSSVPLSPRIDNMSLNIYVLLNNIFLARGKET